MPIRPPGMRRPMPATATPQVPPVLVQVEQAKEAARQADAVATPALGTIPGKPVSVPVPAQADSAIPPSPSRITHFWGEYSFLSTWYHHPITYDGITYPTLTHAYAAQKTLVHKERVAISQMVTAGAAELAGDRCKLRPDWHDVRVEIMASLLNTKYEDEEMRELLLATGDMELVNGEHFGSLVWSVKSGWDADESSGKRVGENLLGIQTMLVRDGLKSRVDV